MTPTTALLVHLHEARAQRASLHVPSAAALLAHLRDARARLAASARYYAVARQGQGFDSGAVSGSPEEAARAALVLGRERWRSGVVRVDLEPEPRGSGPTLHMDVDYPSTQARPRTFTRIVLVSCSGQKAEIGRGRRKLRPDKDGRVRAELLYTSPLFKASLAYARTLVDDSQIRILSALHGAIELDERIGDYNFTMKERSRRDREFWGAQVASRLDSAFAGPLELVVLAGKDYVKAIGPRDWEGWSIRTPLGKMQIGERLHWLNEQISAASGSPRPPPAPPRPPRPPPTIDERDRSALLAAEHYEALGRGRQRRR